jgi:hypothetical protein
MTATAQEFKQASLIGAPRVSVVPRERVEAVTLALVHARARLALPAFEIVWRAGRVGASMGETHWYANGQIEVCLNSTADLSPRQVAWTLLHELRHVADGQQFCSAYYREAEDAANAFAFDVTERQTEDFYRLDWRRPSMRR